MSGSWKNIHFRNPWAGFAVNKAFFPKCFFCFALENPGTAVYNRYGLRNPGSGMLFWVILAGRPGLPSGGMRAWMRK
jgi:hypothetical protein